MNQLIQLVTQIYDFLRQVYGAVRTAIQILEGWEQAAGADIGTLIKNINDVLGTLHDIVSDPTYGNQEIKTEIIALQASVDALGTPQQAGSPVTLPTTPPSGYGGASTGSIADAVWLYPLGYSGLETIQGLQYATAYAYQLGRNQFSDVYYSPYVSVGSNWWNPGQGVVGVVPPVNPVDIISTDTDLGTFLNRAYPTYVWYQDVNTGYWRTDDTNGHYYVRVKWSEQDFKFYKALALGTSLFPVAVPPVWPGASGVTLGTPVAISPPGQTIAVPCHGVIVAVTSTTAWAGKFSFDTAVSWRNAGGISFYNDDGEQEPAQTLGFESGIFLTKAFEMANGVRIRYGSILTGTITPFTIN